MGRRSRRPLDLASRTVATIGQVRSQVDVSRRCSRRVTAVARAEPAPPLRRDPGAVRCAARAAKALGGTVNDAFVTGAVLGAIRYHERRETPLEALNISFVVSTRETGGDDTNAFAPTRVQAPAGPMTVEERFAAIRATLAAGREGARTGGAMGSVAGLANLLPTSVVTGVARSQTANMDFATSNMRGAPVPTYMSGARILWTGTLGPVAGTAFNLTAMSYNGSWTWASTSIPWLSRTPTTLSMHRGGLRGGPGGRGPGPRRRWRSRLRGRAGSAACGHRTARDLQRDPGHVGWVRPASWPRWGPGSWASTARSRPMTAARNSRRVAHASERERRGRPPLTVVTSTNVAHGWVGNERVRLHPDLRNERRARGTGLTKQQVTFQDLLMGPFGYRTVGTRRPMGTWRTSPATT